MSISHSLSNALSGMSAASRMAEIVSTNVANSLTEGYGRRSISLSASQVGDRGAGVSIGAVTRFVDRGVLSDRRLADSGLASNGALVATMKDIENIVGVAGTDGSIASRIVAVETALIDAATDPSSTVRLTALKDRLGDLATGLNAASQSIQDKRVEADRSIADQVSVLNTSLAQVEKLNADIQYLRNNGSDPSSLLDERQRIVDQIAQIVPVREFEREAGAIALTTIEGQTLLDGNAQQFGFTATPTIVADMTLTSGGLHGLTLDGTPIATDGIGKLGGGSLGAAFQARDTELTTAQANLDDLAADVIDRFRNPDASPASPSAHFGLFTDQGSTSAPTTIVGLAGRIQISTAFDPDQGGLVTRLRDGLDAASVGPSGDNSRLLEYSAVVSEPRPSTADPQSLSLAGRAADISSTVSSRRLGFEAELGFENARWSSLKEAEAAQGVDTDYEMQMLLRIEQAYAANARVVQTIDGLMQRLMEI